MPSPCPGMDPYLEGELWQEFHHRLANQISAQLMQVLPERYVALLAKRYVIDRPALSILDLPPEQRVIYPDVHVAKTRRVSESAVSYDGDTMAAPTAEIPRLISEEVPILSVEVRDAAERRLVTIIEILSPVNKRGDGAKEYAERRADLMATHTHILEIDLIRRGHRIALQEAPPSAPYYVYLSRVQRRPMTGVWAIGLREPLPPVPVPLLPPDDDVALSLQTAVSACYDLVHYERLLDYKTTPPPPPLSDGDIAWLDERLRAAGYRKPQRAPSREGGNNNAE